MLTVDNKPTASATVGLLKQEGVLLRMTVIPVTYYCLAAGLPALSRAVSPHSARKPDMGYRLSKICTKTGDDGMTGLGDGSRVQKDHPRVEAYGNVDELNCLIGMLACLKVPPRIRSFLIDIQHDLFDIGGELCIPGHSIIREDQVQRLEDQLDEINALLPPLKEFILPGGSEEASLCHLARAVCRRAERGVITLEEEAQIGPLVIPYLNRLSDLLFIVARFLNKTAGIADVCWDRSRE
jgi:cob(I)alamin adenosyltransferase